MKAVLFQVGAYTRTSMCSNIVLLRKFLAAIDDCLPTAPTGRILSAGTTDRDQIWPSLVEKAVRQIFVWTDMITHSLTIFDHQYMKVMGGYDFRGSCGAHLFERWVTRTDLSLQQLECGSLVCIIL